MSAWYAEGLHFECTQCGHCCTGAPGYVWLRPEEEQAIAKFLELTPKEFRKRYTRLVGKLISLVEKPGTGGDCVFLTAEGLCAIQPVKPRQCLVYPFWERILATRRAWKEAAKHCPGIGRGPLYPEDEVDALADRDTTRDLLWNLMRKRS